MKRGLREKFVLKSDTIVEVKDSESHGNCIDKLKKKKDKINQVKIDALTKLKEKIQKSKLNDDTAEIILDMIEEIQNAEDKG